MESLKPHRCIREKLDSFLFLLVLEGEGTLQVRNKEYPLKKGSIAFVDCMEHYEHISDEVNAWKLAWIHFNGNIARPYYEMFLQYNQNTNVFQAEDVEQWNGMVGQVLDYQKHKNLQADLYSAEILLKLVNEMVIFTAKGNVSDGGKEKKLAREVREYLNEQYAKEDVKETLEQSMGVCMEKLNTSFQTYYGIDIGDYIENRRLNAAKELLRFSVKPMESVAKESGIGDMTFMEQLFREKEGMTAEEYRAKWAQWIR